MCREKIGEKGWVDWKVCFKSKNCQHLQSQKQEIAFQEHQEYIPSIVNRIVIIHLKMQGLFELHLG